jgi:hypothetical protein
MTVLDDLRASAYFQRRANRLRRRNAETRKKARLARYWRNVALSYSGEWTHWPDPRHCSCYLCRCSDMERAARRQALAPRVEWPDGR